MNVYLIGYGNPGRFDDGLGPAFARAVERLAVPGLTVDADYQLGVEDAATAAEHDLVLFADAAVSGPAPFAIRPVAPETAVSFSSHSFTPAAVLGLARELFHASTPGLLLAIRGYQFDGFGEALSEQARANLEAAVERVRELLDAGGLERLCAELLASAAGAAGAAGA